MQPRFAAEKLIQPQGAAKAREVRAAAQRDVLAVVDRVARGGIDQ